MRIGFAGSRFKFFENFVAGYRLVYRLVYEILSRFQPCQAVVGHGGNLASVDAVVDVVARRLGFEVVVFSPGSWSREALLARNRKLVEWCDKLIAIYVDRVTPGTSYTLGYARRLGKPTEVYFVDSVRGLVKRLVS